MIRKLKGHVKRTENDVKGVAAMIWGLLREGSGLMVGDASRILRVREGDKG